MHVKWYRGWTARPAMVPTTGQRPEPPPVGLRMELILFVTYCTRKRLFLRRAEFRTPLWSGRGVKKGAVECWILDELNNGYC